MTVNLDPRMLDKLARARNVVVFTGAGVSKESGIPTFREAQTGIWENYDPNELATLEAFDRQPDIVWGWYALRRTQVRQCEPNPAHLAIAQLEDLFPNVHVVTQNVDDLHERAGSQNVVHLHGGLFHTRCRQCDKPYTLPDSVPPTVDAHRAIHPPECPHCGGPVRPGVVWFGEMLPPKEWTQAVDMVEDCDALLSIGTSSLVFPAAELPFAAAQKGACVIQVNPDPTSLDAVADYNLHGNAGDVMPALVDALESLR